MTVYGYCRVSTVAQANEGESLGAQQRTIRGQAMIMGLEIADQDIFVEAGVSGSIPFDERPEGRRLLEMVKKGDTIISPKLDRCFRSADDALGVLKRLKEAGVSLVLIDLGGDVTGNGIAKLVFTILSAVAETERDRIRERVSTVKADQRKRGLYLGGSVPFGFEVLEGRLVPRQDREQIVTEMRFLKEAGKSLRFIAEHVTSTYGATITHAGVAKVLRQSQEQASA